MAYSTPFTQSFGSHSNMYSLKSGSGMPSMPYHMGSLGLGSLGMSSLDPMHPATMSYGAPCKYSHQAQCLQTSTNFHICSWRQEAEAWEDNLHETAVGCSREFVHQDTLPWHLHEGRGRSQDQLARVKSPGNADKIISLCDSFNWNIFVGLVQEPSCQGEAAISSRQANCDQLRVWDQVPTQAEEDPAQQRLPHPALLSQHQVWGEVSIVRRHLSPGRQLQLQTDRLQLPGRPLLPFSCHHSWLLRRWPGLSSWLRIQCSRVQCEPVLESHHSTRWHWLHLRLRLTDWLSQPEAAPNLSPNAGQGLQRISSPSPDHPLLQLLLPLLHPLQHGLTRLLPAHPLHEPASKLFFSLHGGIQLLQTSLPLQRQHHVRLRILQREISGRQDTLKALSLPDN